MEQTTKRFTFALGILALGFTATTPARADYAVVKFADGFCQIWWDAGAVPFGTNWANNWAKVAVASDWPGAMAALYAAIQNRTCNWYPAADATHATNHLTRVNFFAGAGHRCAGQRPIRRCPRLDAYHRKVLEREPTGSWQ